MSKASAGKMKITNDERYFSGDEFRKPLSLFSVREKHFLYNCWDSVYCELSQDVHDELKEAAEPFVDCSGEAKQALEQVMSLWPCDENGKPLRGDDEEKIRRELAEVDFFVENMMLLLAQSCNMRCRYCYGHGGSYGEEEGLMSEATAFGVLDRYIGQLAVRGGKRIELSFTGGEPLMNYRLLQKIIQHVETNCADWEKKYYITTNGYFLSDEVVAFFVRHKVEVILSFDGPPSIQNFNRPLTSGEDSYETIAPRIKKLLAVLPETSCRATLYDNADTAFVEAGLKEIGFKDIHIVPASESLLPGEYCATKASGADAEKMIDAFCHTADEFLQAARQRDAAGTKKAVANRVFRRIIDTLVSGNDLFERVKQPRKFHHCGAGRRMVAVNVNGEAYPCHRFVGNKKYSLGRIGVELKTDLWRRSILLESPECRTCFCRYSCGGGCAYDNAGKTGNMFSPNPGYCAHFRGMIKYGIYTVSQLSSVDLAWLGKESIIQVPKCVFDL